MEYAKAQNPKGKKTNAIVQIIMQLPSAYDVDLLANNGVGGSIMTTGGNSLLLIVDPNPVDAGDHNRCSAVGVTLRMHDFELKR